MGRVLAVDVGTVRTGVALSDPLQIVASGLDTIVDSDLDRLTDKVSALCLLHEVTEIVVGMPYNTDGSKGEQAAYVDKFIHLLQAKTPLKIVLEDERYTSQIAEGNLVRKKKHGKYQKLDKLEVNKQSAMMILQQYLGSLS